MNKVFRIIIGVLLLPLLYARRFFLLVFIPMLFYRDSVMSHTIPPDNMLDVTIQALFVSIFATSLFYIINNGLIKVTTSLIQKCFKIKYISLNDWDKRSISSVGLSGTRYASIKVRGEVYNFNITCDGSSNQSYEEEDAIRRKAIFYWFFR